MKSTKRILATLLTLALALGLAMPAMAAVNWDEFKITKQPQDLTIKQGESFTLSVEVAIPDGVEVEYQWSASNSSKYIDNANSNVLHLGPDDSCYPTESRLGGNSVDFKCRILVYIKDSDGNVAASRTLWCDTASVRIERTTLGKIIDVTIGPFAYAFSSVIVTAPVSVPLLPLAYLFWLVLFYVSGFRGLFL